MPAIIVRIAKIEISVAGRRVGSIAIYPILRRRAGEIDGRGKQGRSSRHGGFHTCGNLLGAQQIDRRTGQACVDLGEKVGGPLLGALFGGSVIIKAAEEHNQVGVAPANVGQRSLDKGEIVHAAHGKTAAANSTLPPVPVEVFAKHLGVARTGATGLSRRQSRLGDDRSGQ